MIILLIYWPKRPLKLHSFCMWSEDNRFWKYYYWTFLFRICREGEVGGGGGVLEHFVAGVQRKRFTVWLLKTKIGFSCFCFCFCFCFSYRIHCLSGWMSRKTSLDVATRQSRLLQPCGSTISSVVLSGCSGRKEIIAELHPGYSIIWLGSHTPISPYSPLTLTKHISLYSFKEVRGSDLALCRGKEEN